MVRSRGKYPPKYHQRGILRWVSAPPGGPAGLLPGRLAIGLPLLLGREGRRQVVPVLGLPRAQGVERLVGESVVADHRRQHKLEELGGLLVLRGLALDFRHRGLVLRPDPTPRLAPGSRAFCERFRTTFKASKKAMWSVWYTLVASSPQECKLPEYIRSRHRYIGKVNLSMKFPVTAMLASRFRATCQLSHDTIISPSRTMHSAGFMGGSGELRAAEKASRASQSHSSSPNARPLSANFASSSGLCSAKGSSSASKLGRLGGVAVGSFS